MFVSLQRQSQIIVRLNQRNKRIGIRLWIRIDKAPHTFISQFTPLREFSDKIMA
jgi:hypothetical protein